MAKRIVCTPEAVAEFWIIGTKFYSQKLDQVFKETIELLSHFSLLGRQFDNRDERVFVKDYYQIFYLNEVEANKILHLWDSRRNPEELNL